MDLISGRVMVFGTFDVFHPGHRFFIEEALRMSPVGDLVIVIARDGTVRKIKPILRNTEEIRLRVLQEAFPALRIVLGDERDFMRVIREYRPSVICLGYDQMGFSEQMSQEFPQIRVVRLEAFHPEKYKSSKMSSVERSGEL